jgi:hypothetical protein
MSMRMSRKRINMTKQCKDCKHYESHEPENGEKVESGYCHFNPPQIYFNSGGVEDCSFAWVHESEWCSKFEKELNAET